MTKQTEAMELALEALEELHAMVWGECPSLLNEDSGGDSTLDMECKQAITAIKEALAQRTWVGLTHEEIDYIYTGIRAVHHDVDSDVLCRAIEAKLKEKNT